VVKVARKSEQRQMFQYGGSTTQISCKTTTEHGKDDSKGKLAHNPMVGWSSEMLPIMDQIPVFVPFPQIFSTFTGVEFRYVG
jgi:hypothetical protein